MAAAYPVDPAYRDTDPRAGRIRLILFVLYVVVGTIYLSWRLTVFNPEALLASWAFYLVELGGFAGSILLFFITLRRRHRTPPVAADGLRVDVFVTTVNEDIDTVRRTLVAATRIRYPHETWLLDDGNRPAFRAMAAELNCRYLARSDNAGAKAGNLNHALAHATGDFVALFDADHCAAPNFLDRLLGYFGDPTVAFVQTPQDYYNLDSFQHGRERGARVIWHDQSGFHHVEQPGRDHLGAATLCGCSCVLRRAHLDLIGGFPETTVTEDMHAAVKLQKLGLQTVYHDEPLAFGVAPPDLMGFIRQRLRWGEGNMQVCRIEGLPLSRKLTWRQNLGYLLLGFAYADAWRKLVLYVAPIVTLLTETPPVYGEPVAFLAIFVPFTAIGILAYQELYSGFGRILATEAYTMARLTAGLGATLGLVRRKIPFRISSKRLAGRFNLLLVLPYAAILLLGLYAILDWGWFEIRFMADPFALPRNLPRGIALVLALLVAYNCYLAFGVLREAFRSSRSQEKEYLFDLALPFRLPNQRNLDIGWTERISIAEAKANVPASLSLSTGDEITIELFLPGQSIRTPAQVTTRDADGKVELRFLWPALQVRDELDQALHAGRWHRVIAGRHEMTMSPFERIGLLRPPETRRPEAHPVWTPILTCASAPAGPDLRLAYFDPGSADGSGQVIVFGPAADRLDIVSAPDESLAGLTLILDARRPLLALLDESALGIRRGRRFAAASAGAWREAGSFGDGIPHQEDAPLHEINFRLQPRAP